MTKQTISAKAKAAGMTAQTLRRAVTLIERHEQLADEVQQMAADAAEGIRKLSKTLRRTQLGQYWEELDTFREDAQLFRSEVRGMRCVLRLVLRGRLIDAKARLDGEQCDPWDRVAKILKPTVERGLRKFHSDYRPGNVFQLRVMRG